MSNSFRQIKKMGFTNLGGEFLTSEEKLELKRVCVETLSNFDQTHNDFLHEKDGSSGFRALPIHNEKSIPYLEKIISHPKIKALLNDVLGEEYKLWQIEYRMSFPGDPGLDVHQDGPGQFNMAIVLSENPAGKGGTVFLKGSHIVKKLIKKYNILIPAVLTQVLSFLFTKLEAKTGDICFFLNRTWHGRLKNDSELCNEVILMGFFPVGGVFSYEKPYVKWPDEFLEKYDGTELEKAVNPNYNLEHLKNGDCRVVSSQSCPEIPYSMEIENFTGRVSILDRIRLFLSISIIRSSIFYGKILYNFFKKLKRSIA
ncbi:hypothetical protein A9Q84_05285 [Halobacteriovorax marinus]|uniref:Phytanoyl-CoA dioxygenase n=1 Tax=Halobacteriovorax marinus TaxID=97084 RepID=A0A1Y5FB93_9BACT|nr:hypothetical protein A9Q84_05285 [Halobacteriovorax marinus]